MNKKAQFVAILSLFFVLGLIAINYYLAQGTSEVVEMYYTPAYVLKQDSEIKELFFDLNQKVKYSSFKAFRDLCGNSGFYGKECKVWYKEDCNPIKNLKENFKKYFIDYFLESEEYDINVKIKNNKFVISGKYNKGKKIFESSGVKTEVPVEFSYVLGYNAGIFEDLYENCKILSCDKSGKCPISKNECSSGDNYIKIEKVLESNGFIEPKISFILKFEKLEG